VIRPEDEKKTGKMVFALRLSKEMGCILLVAFNNELLRRDVEAEIRWRLEPEGFNFREFRVTDDEYRNLPVMLTDMKPQPVDIFLIYDLRKAMPEVLEYLNYRREDFVEHNISAIFWLDEPTLTAIARKAPDFWAFRSLTAFEFKVERSQDMSMRAQAAFGQTITYATREELENKIALREELLKDYLEKMPEDHSTIAGLYRELGELYYYKALYDEALTCVRKALKLYREIGDRAGEGRTLNGLGLVLQAFGNLESAKENLQRSLEIAEALYGKEHPNIAVAITNLGSVLMNLGDLEGARENVERALAIDEAVYGKNHPKVARHISNLGVVLQALGDLEGAKENVEGALAIDEELYGKEHPNVAIRVNNLGTVLQDLGDLEGAKENFQRALTIDNAVYGKEHPNVARNINNLGGVLRDLGDLKGAKENYLRALAIDEAVYGKEHPSVARDVNNLGSVLLALGDLEGAERHFSRALDICEQFFGNEHPKTQLVRSNLQRLLDSRVSSAP